MNSAFEKRRLWRARHLRSADTFCAGLLLSSAFLLNPSTELRFVQFLLFWFYAWALGKKNNPLITLGVMLGITSFNLITPYGKVLAEWGAFRLTHGALIGGLHKAITLEGLLMLSRASIHPELRLPGTFGALLADCFLVLEQISSRKALVRNSHIGSIIEGIDTLLLELSANEAQSQPAPVEPPRTVKSVFLLLAATSLPLALTVSAYLR